MLTAKLRIPTEQYAFLEPEIAIVGETLEEQIACVLEANRAYNEAVKGTPGVAEKDMNYVVDSMLIGEGVKGGLELYEKMNPTQVYAVQWLKRALKRAEAKEQKLHKITE